MILLLELFCCVYISFFGGLRFLSCRHASSGILAEWEKSNQPSSPAPKCNGIVMNVDVNSSWCWLHVTGFSRLITQLLIMALQFSFHVWELIVFTFKALDSFVGPRRGPGTESPSGKKWSRAFDIKKLSWDWPQKGHSESFSAQQRPLTQTHTHSHMVSHTHSHSYYDAVVEIVRI